MTSAPWPARLMTLDEFAALPEDNSRRYELEEGVLVVSPRPALLHQRVIARLILALGDQLPTEWEVLSEAEVVVTDVDPATVRIPGVLVMSADKDGMRANPGDVLIAVEVISPGSRRKDTLVKPLEYAEAGIPYYWVVDLDPPASLTSYLLVDGHYQESQTVTGEFVAAEPFPIRIDVPALVAPRGTTRA